MKLFVAHRKKGGFRDHGVFLRNGNGEGKMWREESRDLCGSEAIFCTGSGKREFGNGSVEFSELYYLHLTTG